MAELSKQAMEEIQNLAVNGGESGISLSKVQTTPEVGNLVISLGGSGADMLRETKGLINQNCSSDKDKHVAPNRVAYLAFDTAKNEKEKKSSKATGQITLDDNELIILPDGGLSILLDPAIRNDNRARYPYIYRWLDTRIPPLTGQNGAGGIRQAGRAMLFLEMNNVVEAIRRTISKLITGNEVKSLNIYLLAGISGGTGSGTFLDMAYIVRHIAEEIAGVGAHRVSNIRVFGYLLMPDVNLLNADDKTRPNILQNAGAAMQELEHAMKLTEIGEYYTCQYSDNFTLRTNKRPFNYVHLICAKAKDGFVPKEPYQHCLDTVAGSILCFVSGQKKSEDSKQGGVKAEAQFPVDSYYSNIDQTQAIAQQRNTYKERSNCYISTGYACWQIPADRLVKYIFTLMFGKVNDLFLNEPSQDDAFNLLYDLQLDVDAMMLEFMGEIVNNMLNAGNYRASDLFGQNRLDLYNHLNFRDTQNYAMGKFLTNMEGFEARFRERLEKEFRDVRRGPIWTNHVLVSGTAARIDALDNLIAEEKRRTIKRRSEAKVAADTSTAKIDYMVQKEGPRANKRKCQEFIIAWNEYFRAQMEIFCCDLLLGNDIGDNQIGYYDYVASTVARINNQWLEVTRKILEELAAVVKDNTDEFKKASVKDTARGFTWVSGNIPDLDKTLRKILANNGADEETMMAAFLKELLSKAEEWSHNNINVRKFIEDYLQDQASSVLNTSLETLLSTCFKEGNPLDKSVAMGLMPYMAEQAKPLFDGNNTVSGTYNITIPAGCENIERGVRMFTKGEKEYNLETSYLRNRISVICTATGISLHEYTLYEECERVISGNPNAKGLFLNQGEEDVVGRANWMTMPLPLVIPTRKRGVLSPAPERFARYEESLLKEFREMQKARYPFLKLEKTQDGQDYNLYLYRSESLKKTDYYSRIKKENYTKYTGEIDNELLKNLIEELREMRYGKGIQEVNDVPKRLTICENLLNSAKQDMKDRWFNVTPDEEERIKVEVAWEVAEWYYTSAYSFYMRAKEEKAKYDEIEKKIEELEEIRAQIEDRPLRCCLMAKMLATGVVRYEEKNFRYVYELNDDDIQLTEVPSAYLEIRDMKLYEELERLRTGNPMENQKYMDLKYKAEEAFDDRFMEEYNKAYDGDKEALQEVITLYKNLAGIRDDVDSVKKMIETHLAARNTKATASRNSVTQDFYTAYFEGVDNELRTTGLVASRCAALKIVDRKGNLLPQFENFDAKAPSVEPTAKTEIPADRSVPHMTAGGWKCESCGFDANAEVMKFCGRCGKPRKAQGWKCESCGYEGNAETMKFCGQCGKPRKPSGWKCESCGYEGNAEAMKFCGQCGKPRQAQDDSWTCPNCGQTGNTTNFCGQCGTKKPQKMVPGGGAWTCPNCGKSGNTTNFCGGCGTKKPDGNSSPWTCRNGHAGNPVSMKFCGVCGAPRE